MASAQLGGSDGFRVLTVPSSARASALGGNYIAVKDNDINLGIFNPGLLNKEMGRQVALSYLPYFDGIKIGYASYAHHFDSLQTTFSGTVQYVDYAAWERSRIESPQAREQLEAACAELAGAPVVEVAADRRRPAVRTDARSSRVS